MRRFQSKMKPCCARFLIARMLTLSPEFAFQAEADAIARRNAHWRASMRAASARAISSHQRRCDATGARAGRRMVAASGARSFRSASPIICRWSWSRCIAWARAMNGWKTIAISMERRNGLVPVPAANRRDHNRQLARVPRPARARRRTIDRSSPAKSRGLARPLPPCSTCRSSCRAWRQAPRTLSCAWPMRR